jgi:DNA-binding FadR family transcriptional regulator
VPIRQDALAAELRVSKIPLREALARLEQDGLVVSYANRGFFVRPMSPRKPKKSTRCASGWSRTPRRLHASRRTTLTASARGRRSHYSTSTPPRRSRPSVD